MRKFALFAFGALLSVGVFAASSPASAQAWLTGLFGAFNAPSGGGYGAPQGGPGGPQRSFAAPGGYSMPSWLGGTGRQQVAFSGNYPAGAIIINTNERKLYYNLGSGQAISYNVGVGRPGFSWRGKSHVSRKAEWPGWTPPAAMRKREPWLPAYMPGGPDNPLGARALYLGSTLYRIHGTNQQDTIGEAVSSGCFRMMNDDVIDLYDRVKVGAPVYVL